MTQLRSSVKSQRMVLLLCVLTLLAGGQVAAQWRNVSTYYSTCVYTLLAHPSGFYASSNDGVVRSTDDGATWSTPTGTVAYQLTFHGALLEGATYGQIIVSSDYGVTWTFIFLNAEPIFAIVATGQLVFAGSGILPNGEGGPTGIFRTNDDWANWTLVNNGLPVYNTRALVTDGLSIFAGTASGVFVTTNDGGYWSRTFVGIPDTDITALGLKGSMLYAGTSGGHIYCSSDGGWNWTEASQGLPSSILIRAFAFSGSVVFTGTSNGVFVSSNSGTTWQAADPGHPGPSDVTSLAINGPVLFAGDYSTGLWADTLSRLTGVAGDTRASSSPKGFSLSQNYPNPFNPATVISYAIPESREYGVGSMEVKLIVYDLLGREVAMLVNERKAAGRYTVDFDAVCLTTGTYFYRLQAGSFVETRKMVLLK